MPAASMFLYYNPAWRPTRKLLAWNFNSPRITPMFADQSSEQSVRIRVIRGKTKLTAQSKHWGKGMKLTPYARREHVPFLQSSALLDA